MQLYYNQKSTIPVAGVDVPHDLDANGFEAGVHADRDASFRVDRIDAARQVVRQALKKSRADQPKTDSNWVRSKEEESLGYFLTPGEFIVAMIGEGFRFKRNGRSCLFNVDTSTLTNLSSKRTYYARVNRSR